MLTKDQKITLLQATVLQLKGRQLDFEKLSREVAINYPDPLTFNFAYNLHTDFITQDTIPYLLVEWYPEIKSKDREVKDKARTLWMQTKLNLDTIVMLPWKGK